MKQATAQVAVAEVALAAACHDEARAAEVFRASFSAGWTLPALQAELARQTGTRMSLYLNPPKGAVVLSVDEKAGTQARSDLHPTHVTRRGQLRREYEHRRNGTQTLIAAFNTQTGEVFGRC